MDALGWPRSARKANLWVAPRHVQGPLLDLRRVAHANWFGLPDVMVER